MDQSIEQVDPTKLDRVYIDAVFAIDTLVPGSKKKRQADATWARLAVAKAKVYVSPLLLDELWFKALVVFYARDNQGRKFQSDDYTIPKSYYFELEEITTKLLNYKNVELLSMPTEVRPLVDDAMGLIKEASLFPRDAFHMALARAYGIKYIISNDRQLRSSAIRTPVVLYF